MTPAKTLLELSGANLQPPPLTAATLIIIDAQNEYLDGKLALPGVTPALTALARLLAKARAAGAPVVHVKHKGRAGGLFDLEARGGAIIAAVEPAAGEEVVHKPLPNAFAQTDLDARLQRLGRREIVIAGFMTHMCVSSTARAALDLGYRATVAADAAATRDLPDPMGGTIAAEALHRAALAELADRFAIVAKVDQIAQD
ncbi:MAG TPA: isochorismatase family protein [Hyphomicrobiaceae bacterium]|jgi:nicotinamidase-related amidase|nr:isochorismatase family protein [Hyphomicrobiaceae bacterium]